jgi:hypothetical protein
MVSQVFRPRVGIIELIDQPVRLVHYLYYLAMIKSTTDEGKKELEAIATAEALGV